MKYIVFSAMLAVAVPVFGQAKPEPAKPESPKAEPSKAAMAKPAVARKASPKRHEDARQCLERATNSELIKCADEYL